MIYVSVIKYGNSACFTEGYYFFILPNSVADEIS